ncbi:hypothetical protein BGZ94_007401 [Podila epigama]|nr:hypothetical protein BGZ94_007401 [Podila epigama]
MSNKVHQDPSSSSSSSSSSLLNNILIPKVTTNIVKTPPPPEHLNLKPLLSSRRQLEDIVALTVQNILSAQECQDLIARSESLGYDVALVNSASGQGIHLPGYRDGQRCIVDDIPFAAQLWERIRPYLPAVYQNRPVVGLNERMRFLKYLPGDKFEAHMDGEYRRQDGSNHCTKMTVQFYLNDACEGGATTFLDENGLWKSEMAKKDTTTADNINAVLEVAVPPRVGQILVFQHNLVHEGSPVKAGIKYVIRTDVLYGPPTTNRSFAPTRST